MNNSKKLKTRFTSQFQDSRDPSCPRQHIVKYYRSDSDFFPFTETKYLCPTEQELNSFINVDHGEASSGHTGFPSHSKNRYIDFENKYYLDDH